jgi:hypothetical protein
MGLNRHMHYQMKTEQDSHALGDLLAPKAHWSGFVEAPGLQTLTILGPRGEAVARRRQVTVQPSQRVPFGMYVATNEHHDIEQGPDSVSNAMQTLRSSWTDSMRDAKIEAERLLDLTR